MLDRSRRIGDTRCRETPMDEYQPLGAAHDIGFPRKQFFLDLEWCDATPPPHGDYTRFSVRQRPGVAPECSFVVIVTGSAPNSGAHPMAPTEALKLAVLYAISDEVRRLLRAGQVPGADHPVMVTQGHFDRGHDQANNPS
jgi:hypothetical protein